MLALSIRRIQSDEAKSLRDLAERTFRDAWQDQNEPDAFEQYCRENFSLEKVKAELAAPGAEFYFAFINGQPAAYLKLNLDCRPHWPDDSKSSDQWTGKALQLERIYVLQNVQSQGLGAELLRFSESRARETGASWIWLSVWQKAPRSIKFYEKNGFSIFGIETFWVGNDPQPDWLMRKRV